MVSIYRRCRCTWSYTTRGHLQRAWTKLEDRKGKTKGTFDLPELFGRTQLSCLPRPADGGLPLSRALSALRRRRDCSMAMGRPCPIRRLRRVSVSVSVVDWTSTGTIWGRLHPTRSLGDVTLRGCRRRGRPRRSIFFMRIRWIIIVVPKWEERERGEDCHVLWLEPWWTRLARPRI
jgi:hypothetical protein